MDIQIAQIKIMKRIEKKQHSRMKVVKLMPEVQEQRLSRAGLLLWMQEREESNSFPITCTGF